MKDQHNIKWEIRKEKNCNLKKGRQQKQEQSTAKQERSTAKQERSTAKQERTTANCGKTEIQIARKTKILCIKVI